MEFTARPIGIIHTSFADRGATPNKEKRLNMKIAVITEDGQTISQHFGRAPYYLVFTVKDNEIVGKELRDKVGHRQFAQEDHASDNDPRGHGFGAHSEAKHASMIESIQDCAAIIVRGMGRGAYLAMEQAHIRPFVTDLADAEEAVKAYIGGTLEDHTDRLH
jgi:predicted Fe-Mo cluster-binding NifX family protein